VLHVWNDFISHNIKQNHMEEGERVPKGTIVSNIAKYVFYSIS
jgi:hypothetical protein